MSTFSTCTSSFRPPSPNDGDVLFETDTKNVIIWDGSNWRGYQNDGVSYNFSQSDYSIDLDGTDDYISVNSVAPSLAGVSNFTITAWVRIASTSVGGGILWASRNNDFSYRVYVALISGRPYFQIQNGASNYSVFPTATISANTWTHFSAVLNSNTMRLYVNDSEVSGSGVSAATTDSSLALSTIGARGYNSSGNVDLYLDGQLDDVAVFDYALSSAERTALYSNHAYSNPVALWRFENDVSDENDNHNGTSSGTPAFLAKSDNSSNTPY